MHFFIRGGRLSLRVIAVNAAIAALYFVLSFFLQPLTFGAFQFRIAEFMTVLPLFSWTNVIGLTVGCLLTNVFSPFGVADMIIGTAATLISGILTYLFRKLPPVGAAFPVLVNAVMIPVVIFLAEGAAAYFTVLLSILVSQAVIVYAIGIPFYYATRTRLGKFFAA